VSSHAPGVYCSSGALSILASFNGYTFFASSVSVSSSGKTFTPASTPWPRQALFIVTGSDQAGCQTVVSGAVQVQPLLCAFSMTGNSDSMTGDIYVTRGTIAIAGGGSTTGSGFMESLKFNVSGNFANYSGTGPLDPGGVHTTTTTVPVTTVTTPGTTNSGSTVAGTTNSGSTTPGTTNADSTTPGTTTPGSTTPGSTTPGSTTPTTIFPGTTTPGSTQTATTGTTVALNE
jgi:hypothetical protein